MKNCFYGKGKMNFMRRTILLSLLMLLTGCASGYSKFYTPKIDGDFAYNLETLKEGQTPAIVKTNDLDREVERYLSKNFAVIGFSSFNGGMESDDNIISQAKEVKATLVLQTSKFITTQGNSTPLVMPNSFTKGGTGGVTVTSMYNQQMRYDQAAVFMAKSIKKPRFGLYFRDLTPEEKKQFERNTGIVAHIINEESPVFDANIVPDDLIIAIDGNNVRGQEHANQLLDAIPQSANKVIFKLIRNKIEKDIVVYLIKP